MEPLLHSFLTWMADTRRRWLEVPPEWLFVISFILLIAVGTAGLLWLPGLYVGAPLPFLDALFTATSAACVTGLAVVDTATHFTMAGQAWLLLLIQLGGLGLIGITSVIISALGQRLSLRTEMIVAPTLHALHGTQLLGLTWRIFKFTLAVEAAVACGLFALWLPRYGAGPAAWHAVFHAVSAFCNAGFSTFSDSLIGQADRPAVLFSLSLAVILGGFGYLSIQELGQWLRQRGQPGYRRLSIHTYSVVLVSVLLLGGGALSYAVLEWRGVLADLSTVDAVSNAWFMSATARTAGFNSVPYDRLENGSVLLTLLLMVVGGSPGSTAGGIKTTSVAILVALAWSRSRGRRFAQIYQRSVPEGTVQRTVSLVLLFLTVVVSVTVLLSFSETSGLDVAASRQAFLPLVFETVSALGTVGLSMNLTPQISPLGRGLLILAMFIGRVGPLAFFALISLRGRQGASSIRSAAEDVIVG